MLSRSFTKNEIPQIKNSIFLILSDIECEIPQMMNCCTHVFQHSMESVELFGPNRVTNMFSFEQQIGFNSRNVKNHRNHLSNCAMNYKRFTVFQKFKPYITSMTQNRNSKFVSQNIVLLNNDLLNFNINLSLPVCILSF